jgi:hypothetical protein
LSTALNNAHNAGQFGQDEVDNGLPNYFGYLLENVAVSGIALLVKWSDLSPMDPGDDFNNPAPSGSLRFDYIEAALKAIEAWNSQRHFLQEPRTLQLIITPGFHSPDWLFPAMDSAGTGSCDGLFTGGVSPATTLSECGYTNIFYDVEDALANSAQAKQISFPLPWNSIYKTKWQNFLTFLNGYIGSRPEFVSIAVAGPTASSEEMILPNGKPGTLNAGSQALKLPGMSQGISVYTAWNCLLGNNYGVTGTCISNPSYGMGSDYVNTDRAFIEEWAAAIDMYGQIFSGVTLVVTTGQGLPNFCGPGTGPSGTPSCPFSYPFLTPPPAFAPDCGSMPTMDCAAETAILAYFAGPPVGGANAKATAMAGLSTSPGPALSSSSVKWLSEKTTGKSFSVLPNSTALVSRMLGGAQFASPFSSTSNISKAEQMLAEKMLLDVLKNFFIGTRAAFAFGTDLGTGMNGSDYFVNAPINYLQVWDNDLIYAAGLSSCTTALFQNAPPTNGAPAPGCMRETIPSIPFMGVAGGATAEYLLSLANYSILLNTAEPVALPATCGCSDGFVPRGAFLGDLVCVTQMQQNQVETDNNNANASSTGTYSSDYTNSPPPPSVPYGVCKILSSLVVSLTYRQAYMGDYVCVGSSYGDPLHPGEAQQVASDNASYPSNGQACLLPLPLPLPGPPFPSPR